MRLYETCSSSETNSYGNTWRDVVFEQCYAGAIYALAHFGAVLDNVSPWDTNKVATASSADFIHFGKNAANIGTHGVTIKNSLRSNSTLGTGKYGISLAAGAHRELPAGPGRRRDQPRRAHRSTGARNLGRHTDQRHQSARSGAGAQVSITFGTPMAETPVVTGAASNAAAAGLQPYATGVSATGFTLACAASPASGSASGTYSLNWQASN